VLNASQKATTPADLEVPVVALDGGTTNTRARLVRDGRVVASVTRSIGVRDVVRESTQRPLIEAVRGCLLELRERTGIAAAEIVASGMLTSDVGIVGVPHVAAPAGLEELAKGSARRTVEDVWQQPIMFVPGVKSPADSGPLGWTSVDVMRGEECETIGAWLALRPGGPCAFLWPGSHTKLVAVDAAGTIVRGYTTLAGELTSAVARHTLVAASLTGDWPQSPDPEAVAAGVRIVEREGLGRAAFLIRVADLTNSLDAPRRWAFWMGAAIAEDVNVLARNPILGEAVELFIGGRRPQRSLYASLLRARLNGTIREIDDELAESASAMGAAAVLRLVRVQA
jgi:2-dehydro-3-deoxygalactonokinase